uniref:Uncharacterized protein n=1 Tax=Rhizophora mucronata TaxID=61149 RepID=A0A2P2L0X6_RHIMU
MGFFDFVFSVLFFSDAVSTGRNQTEIPSLFIYLFVFITLTSLEYVTQVIAILINLTFCCFCSGAL